jgi:hypothetical protein
MSQRKTYKNHLKRFNATTSSELTSLVEMFPDWEAEDLLTLLAENHNQLEVVIDLIVNNKVAKWEPTKKEKKKKQEVQVEEPVNIPVDSHKHNKVKKGKFEKKKSRWKRLWL